MESNFPQLSKCFFFRTLRTAIKKQKKIQIIEEMKKNGTNNNR